MSESVKTLSMAIPDCRSDLVNGSLRVPLALGLTARVAHVERGERECFGAALEDIAPILGPAARVIECGPFAGLMMGQILSALERPKAGVVMTSAFEPRQLARLQESVTTAQITHIEHDAHMPSWPLEAIGAGKTLVLVGGGGFGLTPQSQAFSILKQASQALSHGDFVALTLESPRDGAIMDAAYCDYGADLVVQAVSNLGRMEGLEPRSFYDATANIVRFGALASQNASLTWNGTRCGFDAGAWLDMGGMTLHSAETILNLHPEFALQDHWQSQDKAISLVLLRKI